MIAYFAADLLWATKIKCTAEALGIEARPVRNADMLGARLGDSDVRGLIVDLDAPETALALVAMLRGAPRAEGGAGKAGNCRPVRVVAFGPHVETDALNRARGAGAHSVLTRGAFSARLPDLLTELGRHAPAPKPDGPTRSRRSGLP